MDNLIMILPVFILSLIAILAHDPRIKFNYGLCAIVLLIVMVSKSLTNKLELIQGMI